MAGEDEIAAHLDAARRAWPDELPRDPAAYEAWLRAACANDPAVRTRLPHLVPAELVVGWACSIGDPAAHALLDRVYLRQIPDAIRRIRAAAAHVDDVVQHVRIKLLAPRPDDPPGTPTPIGRMVVAGSLAGLVRVMAVRYAISLARQRGPLVGDDALAEQASDDDPELRNLKRRYAAEFHRAMRDALVELTPRQRQLLHLHLSAHATIDDLARMYRTHRSTTARWLEDARTALAEGVRRLLASRLELAPDELQSLLRFVRSEASRLLASLPPEDL